MKLFSSFHIFDFTRNEIKVVLLLAITLVAGIALRYFGPSSRPARNSNQPFDYSIPDSIFLARSTKANLATTATGDVPDSSSSSTPTRPSRTSIININKANKHELMQLPGIGEAYAERIVIYRDDHGPFKTVDELENVKGIGRKKLERIKPLATVK